MMPEGKYLQRINEMQLPNTIRYLNIVAEDDKIITPNTSAKLPSTAYEAGTRYAQLILHSHHLCVLEEPEVIAAITKHINDELEYKLAGNC